MSSCTALSPVWCAHLLSSHTLLVLWCIGLAEPHGSHQWKEATLPCTWHARPWAQLHRWPVSAGNAQLASHHWLLRGHLPSAAKADGVKTPDEAPYQKQFRKPFGASLPHRDTNKLTLVSELHPQTAKFR
jgi:hypothetical protein